MSITRCLASFAIVITLALLGGCAEKSTPESETKGLLPIVVQLDWVAEPEHGGFYQAAANDWFKEAGLDVRLDQGGPNGFGMRKLASRKAHFAQADSTTVLLAIAEGLPIVNVSAVFQNDPSVLMLHADNPISSFPELDGTTIMARPEWAFLPYLRYKYDIDFNIVPQNFSVTNFIADPNFIQQGFYIAEPFYIEQGGAPKPKFLYAWDAGFDAYTVLAVHRGWAEAHPQATRDFLTVYIRGWRDYLFGDPTPAHELMKVVNPKNTDAFLEFSRQMIIDERLVIGRENGGPGQIGRVSLERFSIQLEQLKSLNILPNNSPLTAEQVVTTRYLP